MSEEIKKSNLKTIQDSLVVLKAFGDQTVVNETEKIEGAVKNLIAVNKPLIEDYAKEIKAFDQGIVGKYGLQVARVIEFGMIACIAAKLFLF